MERWPEMDDDGWFEEDWDLNDLWLIAGELDHRLTRAERTHLILSSSTPKKEDYSD